MYSEFGFKNIPDQLQNEMSQYLRQNEPPLEHQIIRILMSLNSEITSKDNYFDVNKVKFLTSSDTNKSSIIISLPCEKISQNLNDLIIQIMAKFNYKIHNKSYIENLSELQFYFKI
jgi:hypothetical protein